MFASNSAISIINDREVDGNEKDSFYGKIEKLLALIDQRCILLVIEFLPVHSARFHSFFTVLELHT